MYDHNVPGAIAMRMSIFFRGTAVCGPSGMSDAVGSVERIHTDGFFQISQLAFRAPNLQALSISANRNPRGIVPPIFQAP
jgi:hypothetical protein